MKFNRIIFQFANILRHNFGIQLSTQQLCEVIYEAAIDFINQADINEIIKNVVKTTFQMANTNQKAEIYFFTQNFELQTFINEIERFRPGLNVEIRSIQKVGAAQSFHFGSENMDAVVLDMIKIFTEKVEN